MVTLLQAPEACFQRFPALVELSQEHFLQRLCHTKLDLLFKILVNCVWKSSCPLTISQLLLCPRIFLKYSTVSQKWCRSEKPLLHHLLHVISSWRLCCLAVAVCKRMVGYQASTHLQTAWGRVSCVTLAAFEMQRGHGKIFRAVGEAPVKWYCAVRIMYLYFAHG